MTPANPDDVSTTDGSAGIDRRRLLQLAGGSAIGVAAIGEAVATTNQSESGPAHEFVFYGCEEVCTNTSGNHVIVHRDGEYTCERIVEKTNRTPVTWTHDNTYCYNAEEAAAEAEQKPGQIVGALGENEYRGDEHVGEGCRLCLNPNDCAADYLPDDPCKITEQLEECGPCLDGDGADIVHCGGCESATSASNIERSGGQGGDG